jgi:hypothetical protein
MGTSPPQGRYTRNAVTMPCGWLSDCGEAMSCLIARAGTQQPARTDRATGLSFLILLEQLLDPFGRFLGGLFRGHVALRDIGFRLRPDLLGQHG